VFSNVLLLTEKSMHDSFHNHSVKVITWPKYTPEEYLELVTAWEQHPWVQKKYNRSDHNRKFCGSFPQNGFIDSRCSDFELFRDCWTSEFSNFLNKTILMPVFVRTNETKVSYAMNLTCLRVVSGSVNTSH